MKKVIISALILLSIGSMNVSAEERRFENTKYGVIEIIIPDYFKKVYKDTDNPLEKYVPMIYKGETMPFCIERIYQWYYIDDNGDKQYIDVNETPIYDIYGEDYISIRNND